MPVVAVAPGGQDFPPHFQAGFVMRADLDGLVLGDFVPHTRPAAAQCSAPPLALPLGSWRLPVKSAFVARLPKYPRGGRKNKTRKRRTSAPARKKKYVRTFFFLNFLLVRFWAFLGKGSSKTRGKKNEYVSKKNRRGNIFSGAEFFSG
jgi:hypothetical protein